MEHIGEGNQYHQWTFMKQRDPGMYSKSSCRI